VTPPGTPPATPPRSARLRRGALAAVASCAVLLGLGCPAAAARPAHAPAVPQQDPVYHDSGLAPTPYMGWNTYYGLGAPTEAAVKSVARTLISTGLKKAGYDIVWLDGGWQADQPRDAQGRLTANPERFPDGIPALVSYLHERGLRVGIYTDAGTYDGKNCGLGSGGHYDQDARQFAAWDIDAVKVDFLCGIAQQLDPATAFRAFSAAVARTGHPMLLNLCNPLTDGWGLPHTPAQDAHNAYVYGPTTADSWRTGTDLAWGSPTAGEWPNILRAIDANAAHPEATGPGHYNDPDYLVPMRRLSDGGYEMGEEESTTQLVMWAEMAAPLIIGSDPRTLPQSMIDTLRNPEIVAVDQDPLDVQGVRIADTATGEVYGKVLSGHGRRAVVLLNRSAEPAEMTVHFADAALRGPVAVRDLRARADRGVHTGGYTVTVPGHGTAFLELTGADAVPGTDLGAGTPTDPAVARAADGTTTVFARTAGGTLRERTGTGPWRDLGGPAGPAGGRILGQPAAYASPGGRIDVFVRGADSAAYRRTYADGRWGRWTSLGGRLTEAPTVAFSGPDSWTLLARGADGTVVARGPQTTWSDIGAPPDQPLYGRPSAAVDSSGTLHVAVRTASDAVWERTRDASGAWQPWTDLGGTVSGSPTLVATGGTVQLYARALDYTLWQRTYGAQGWGGWFKRTEFPSAAFSGALGATAGPDGSVLAVLRGVDGRVHEVAL
jgi:alpha-galactosidase